MNVVEIGHNTETYREAAAKRIKQLMQKWTENTLALGAELAAAAETFPIEPTTGRGRPPRIKEPRFLKWAMEITSLSDRQIEQLVLIHKKFGGENRSTLEHLPQRVMKLLVKADVPESARREALDRAEKGEHIGTSDAKRIIQGHKYPTAKEANAQAKDEGRPVLARDGFIYFGTDPRRAKEGEDRRTMVYGVRKALDTLGNIHLNGRQFLDYALPHQLWDAEEAKIIKQALRWLMSLNEAWDSRE
jgi:hypothetical protein